MQDFTLYNYKITLDGIRKAAEAGQNITVIINGEYYDLTPEEESKERETESMSKRELDAVRTNLLASGYTEEEAAEIIEIILLSL